MAMLGLRFCARAFSSCGNWEPLFIAVRGPLTIVASLVAEHRLQTRRLSSCGSRAQLLRGMWDLPRPGLELVSPALAGRFSTTAPPGKSVKHLSWLIYNVCVWIPPCLMLWPWLLLPLVCICVYGPLSLLRFSAVPSWVFTYTHHSVGLCLEFQLRAFLIDRCVPCYKFDMANTFYLSYSVIQLFNTSFVLVYFTRCNSVFVGGHVHVHTYSRNLEYLYSVFSF